MGRARYNRYMERTGALADALRAAAADADAIHHDLCPGALIDGDREGACSCGVPDLLRELAARAERRPPALRRPAAGAPPNYGRGGAPAAGVGFEVAAARRRAALGPCAHSGAAPVDISTLGRVAWLCPDCLEQLPADWRTGM